MLLSCKFSHNLLTYLETRGEDLTGLFQQLNLPEELLRDPSCWVPVEEFEDFFLKIQRWPWSTKHVDVLEQSAHLTGELRTWGILDSVLRMMPRLEEAFAQPRRLMGHFISPESLILSAQKQDASMMFELPSELQNFPLSKQYLAWSFEALPTFFNLPVGTATWSNSNLTLRWGMAQELIFENESERQVSPDLLRQIVADLEDHQVALQKRKLHEAMVQTPLSRREIADEQEESGEPASKSQAGFERDPKIRPEPLAASDQQDLEALKHNLSKMTDAFVRAQQLITLLVAQGRQTPQVKEAMRRVQWEQAQQTFTPIARDSFQIIESLQQPPERTHHV